MQTDNSNMKLCSTSQVIRKMQIKTTMKQPIYYDAYYQRNKIYESVGEDVEKNQTCGHCW
jgi:hypothetical protein